MDDSSRTVRPPSIDLSWIRERITARVPSAPNADLSSFGSPQPESRGSLSPQRRAAVAAVLREAAAGLEVLLIRRAEHPRDPWSGHMAFPGGREDDADADLLGTAVRETREELSLDLLQHARLLGRLDEMPAIARGRRIGLSITPFVFELTTQVPFVPNEEVAEALWAPFLPLMRGELLTTIPYEIEGRHIALPAHDVQGHIVWGLTFRMLDSLFALLR